MKKGIYLVVFLTLFVSTICQAQTYLKWNSIYWALGVLNTSVETKIGKNWTFNGDIIFSPWESINGNSLIVGELIPEARYYYKQAFKGFYTGAFASAHTFKITKWNYINSGRYQKGFGYALGLNIGYEFDISQRWKLDLFVGYAYQNSEYRGYDSKGNMYVGWNGSGEWIPYRIGASFAYRL